MALHRTEALANVVMHVKKGTSRWLKEQSPDFQRFNWQDGYVAFSVGRSQRDEVSRTLSACELIINDPGSQGGASCARWPWAGMRCTFGAKDNAMSTAGAHTTVQARIRDSARLRLLNAQISTTITELTRMTHSPCIRSR